MKKKILALLLVAVFALTACEKVEKKESTKSTGESSKPVAKTTIELTGEGLEKMREKYEVEVDSLKAEDFSENSTMSKILKNGKLIVATNATYPPYEFRLPIDGDSVECGIDMEMARLLAKKMNVELEIVDTSFDSLITGLGTDMYNLVLAGMNNTPERAEQVTFTEDYFAPNLVLLIKESDVDKYKSEKDIPDDFKFGNQMGTVQEEVTIQHFPKATEGDNSLYLKSYADLILALQAGQIDGILVEDIIAEAFMAQNPDLTTVKGLEYPGESGFAGAVKKDDTEFKEYLDKFIKEIKDNKTLDKIVVDSNELAGVVEE